MDSCCVHRMVYFCPPVSWFRHYLSPIKKSHWSVRKAKSSKSILNICNFTHLPTLLPIVNISEIPIGNFAKYSCYEYAKTTGYVSTIWFFSYCLQHSNVDGFAVNETDDRWHKIPFYGYVFLVSDWEKQPERRFTDTHREREKKCVCVGGGGGWGGGGEGCRRAERAGAWRGGGEWGGYGGTRMWTLPVLAIFSRFFCFNNEHISCYKTGAHCHGFMFTSWVNESIIYISSEHKKVQTNSCLS